MVLIINNVLLLIQLQLLLYYSTYRPCKGAEPPSIVSSLQEDAKLDSSVSGAIQIAAKDDDCNDDDLVNIVSVGSVWHFVSKCQPCVFFGKGMHERCAARSLPSLLGRRVQEKEKRDTTHMPLTPSAPDVGRTIQVFKQLEEKLLLRHQSTSTATTDQKQTLVFRLRRKTVLCLRGSKDLLGPANT